MITRKELNEVLNKKVIITSVSNGVQIYKDTLNKTGMIEIGKARNPISFS
mgnify:CR=1 FL=1